MKKFLLAFLLFSFVLSPVFGVEEEVGVIEVEGEVSADEVPMPGTFASWWLANVTERFELFVARTDERKVELEEKFADRREAQLEKLESLPDDHPQKEELISRLEDRYDKHLDNIEARAEKLTDKKMEILDRLEDKKDRFDAKKEWIQEKKAERVEMKEAVKEKIQEKIQTRTETLERVRENINEDAIQRQEEFKTRVQNDLEDKTDAVAPRVDSAKMKKGSQLNTEEYNTVLGASDYQPMGVFEKLGWWMAGR